jgi:RNA polymerase sigma factor (TIGR02999 family)
VPLPVSDDVTSLLIAWGEGDESALAVLVPRVYAELHRLAHHQLRGERHAQTLQTTALVNEAYLRLVDTRRVRWESRAHFLGVAAQAMRRILVDAARARGARKRGGGVPLVSLDEAPPKAFERDRSLVALDDALTALAKVDARKSRVVELRYFAGLSVDDTAAVLRVSPETVQREWRTAKAWLLCELSGGAASQDGRTLARSRARVSRGAGARRVGARGGVGESLFR